MPMLMSTGNCPSPSGRNTSALSLAPSRIGMSTSFSTFILYWGSDALVSLAVATCSCTVPPNGLPSTANAIRAQRVRLRRSVRTSRRAPHLVRGLDDKAQLRDLAGLLHGVAANAAGKSALRTECELLQRRILGRFIDASLELVLRFEVAALRRDQAENGDLALGEKAQRLEIAGPRAVVFQEIAVHADLVEDQFGDRLVAALRHPPARQISAAEMHARRHALRPDLEPDLFLQTYYVADCSVLNALELDIRDLALRRLFARVDQRSGSDQAADVLGAEGRRAASHERWPPAA